jgi:hypothetical protein
VLGRRRLPQRRKDAKTQRRKDAKTQSKQQQKARKGEHLAENADTRRKETREKGETRRTERRCIWQRSRRSQTCRDERPRSFNTRGLCAAAESSRQPSCCLPRTANLDVFGSSPARRGEGSGRGQTAIARRVHTGDAWKPGPRHQERTAPDARRTNRVPDTTGVSPHPCGSHASLHCASNPPDGLAELPSLPQQMRQTVFNNQIEELIDRRPLRSQHLAAGWQGWAVRDMNGRSSSEQVSKKTPAKVFIRRVYRHLSEGTIA